MIVCKKEDLQEVLKKLWKKVENRPCNKAGKRDGNFNYVHQQDLADAIVNFINEFDREPKLDTIKQGDDFPDTEEEINMDEQEKIN